MEAKLAFDLKKAIVGSTRALSDAKDSVVQGINGLAKAAGQAGSGVASTVASIASDPYSAIDGAKNAVTETVGSLLAASEESVVYCKSCGSKVVVTARFCSGCGARINADLSALPSDAPGILNELLLSLCVSPLELKKQNTERIHAVFPVPREQRILWADAEFDMRPSGIALTNRGLFIKTDVGVFEHLDKEAPNNGKSILRYYRWSDFEPAWFAGEDEGNQALCVDEAVRGSFIAACKTLAAAEERRSTREFDSICLNREEPLNDALAKGVADAAMAPIAKQAKYVDRHARTHNQAGHGEMAEQAINMLDRMEGRSVEWCGPDNSKNGADRIVDGVWIQTKYYNSARGSLEAAFDPATGQYRYMNGDSPMQLEVPKDQYDAVLAGFKKKIEAGKVDGVTDPAQAELIVRKGRLDYQQAVNLTKSGTIESLKYDAASGVVVCSCAFGLTFVATVFMTYQRCGDISTSIQAGAIAGTQVFGISFVQHMLASQLSRTSLADALIVPSQIIVQKMGYRATQVIVNGLRAIAGKQAISGVAASNQLAKILRGNAITAAVTLAVFSVPETYNLINKKISGAQFAKNMAVLAGGVAAGAGGAVAAGASAAKVAGMAGTAVTPGVGTAVGVVGGFVGGVVGSLAVQTVGDIICEDDAEVAGRFFNAMIAVLASEYLLADSEIEALMNELNEIDQKRFKSLFEDFRSSELQEEAMRLFLAPVFDRVAAGRKPFSLPSSDEINDAIEDLCEAANGEAIQAV